LRAAAPEAKDQRDRRRRARLKDRYAVRVASGQTMPELKLKGQEVENGLLSPKSEADGSESGASTGGLTSPTNEGEGASVEGDDTSVADRAASMLMGLRSGDVSETPEDVLRVRRRRESADEERARRRRRRQQGTSDQSVASSTGATGMLSPTIEEEGDATILPNDVVKVENELSPLPSQHGDMPLTPVTIISPPSPASSSQRGDYDGGEGIAGLGLSTADNG